MKLFISTEEELHLEELYGKQQHPLDYFKWGWSFKTIESLLSKANFVRLHETDSPKSHPDSLSLIAYKKL